MQHSGAFSTEIIEGITKEHIQRSRLLPKERKLKLKHSKSAPVIPSRTPFSGNNPHPSEQGDEIRTTIKTHFTNVSVHNAVKLK
jgi:hypothetical protein